MKIVRSCGYNDFYRKRGKTETVVFWERVTAGDYDYDDGEFVSVAQGTGEFDGFTVDVPIQESDNMFDKEFATPDIYIAKPGIIGATLKIYFSILTSMANVEFRIAGDSNIDTSDDHLLKNSSAPEQTGSFQNSPVRFCGKRRVEVPSIISNFRTSSRLRVNCKVKYDGAGYDDILIRSMTMLSDDILFIDGGGADAED